MASTGSYNFTIYGLNVGAGVVELLFRSWPREEEATAKRVATACWEARRALLAARPHAGEAEQRAAVEGALLEACGALDAWRLLQRAGGEAPADSAAELSAPQLDAARTLLKRVGRDRWGSLPAFVRRHIEEGGRAVSKAALKDLVK